jgi:hypothetical protein
MKRIIMLVIVLVTMIVSLGGCYRGYAERDRGEWHDRNRGERYEYDRNRGHDRGEERDYDRHKGHDRGEERDYDRDGGHDEKR